MLMVEQITTADLPPKDRLHYWNDLAARMVAPVRVSQLDDMFSASMHRVALRECEIISVRSSPAQIVSQGADPPAMLNLQIQHIGASTNWVRGRTCRLEEGDFLLFDPSEATHLAFDVPTEVLIVRLPVAIMETRLPRLRHAVGLKMSGQSGPGALFSNFLRAAWRQLDDDQGPWVEALDDVIWPLLDLAYASEQLDLQEGSARETRRRALFQVIADNLCDPDFDVHRIARQLSVSARYVQMLFAEMATTPSAYIQNQRLDLAGSRLRKEGARCSITNVAFDVGFNDLSSFCRAFRRRFHVAPREYRAGVRGRPREMRLHA